MNGDTDDNCTLLSGSSDDVDNMLLKDNTDDDTDGDGDGDDDDGDGDDEEEEEEEDEDDVEA